MWKFLEFLGYMAVMLSIIPLTGLAFGGWRESWRFTKAWAKAIGWLIAAACVVGVIVFPFMPR